MITKDDAVEEACAIMALAYKSLGDYSHPSDGFCRKCPGGRSKDWNYRNDGYALEYMRLAVLEKLARDGIKVAEGFNPSTGRPYNEPGVEK